MSTPTTPTTPTTTHSSLTNPANRRRFERFVLNPGYTPVSVSRIKGNIKPLEGHSLDICEGGVQFELDRAIKPGTEVSVQITLPVDSRDPDSTTLTGRSVIAYGNVVWMDNSEPGPVRMAVRFSRFFNEGDRERMLARLARRGLKRVA